MNPPIRSAEDLVIIAVGTSIMDSDGFSIFSALVKQPNGQWLTSDGMLLNPEQIVFPAAIVELL